VLPDPDNRPTEAAELAEVSAVALAVPGDLLSPEGGESALPQREPVTMPEVSVEENSNALPREDDVRRAREASHVFPKAEPPVMQRRADDAF
jgi:hypothetical protein